MERIRSWDDPWLPTTPPRPTRLTSSTDPNLKVSDIINPYSKRWDEDQIKQLVEPQDHHLITKIYLPQWPIKDTGFWSYTKDEFYTVKSGY